MIEIDKQVCSLDLAKRLKKLGVKFRPVLFWDRPGIFLPGFSNEKEEDGYEVVLLTRDVSKEEAEYIYAAYSVGELGEMLPEFIATYKAACRNENEKWRLLSHSGTDEYNLNIENISQFSASTEADCRAKVLIYLIENGYVRVEYL